MSKAEATCPPEEMDSEDPLFIIYTSGTSEKPKGIVHSQAGYLLYAAVTHQVNNFNKVFYFNILTVLFVVYMGCYILVLDKINMVFKVVFCNQ